jgi:hypothetical protein
MKAPDLARVDDAGLNDWTGPLEPLRAAARAAKLKFATVDLGRAKDKATLFAELDRGLGLPDHFGHNWDALADVLEDRDWLGSGGRVIALQRAGALRRDHAADAEMLEDILAEASAFWQERRVPFWVFAVVE